MKLNKKVITGAIALSAMLGIGSLNQMNSDYHTALGDETNSKVEQDLKNDENSQTTPSSKQSSTQYQNSNTLPQTSEHNSQSAILVGSTMTGLGLGLTGIDLVKKRMIERP